EFVFKRKILETKRFKDLPLAWCSDYLAVLECSNFGNMYTINEAFMLFRLSGLNITSKKDDLTPKNVATFNFYYYLLDKKHTFFNKGQIEALYYMLEKTFLDNKKSIKFWVLFTKLYLSYFQINRYFNFFRKALRLVLKNKHD